MNSFRKLLSNFLQKNQGKWNIFQNCQENFLLIYWKLFEIEQLIWRNHKISLTNIFFSRQMILENFSPTEWKLNQSLRKVCAWTRLEATRLHYLPTHTLSRSMPCPFNLAGTSQPLSYHPSPQRGLRLPNDSEHYALVEMRSHQTI